MEPLQGTVEQRRADTEHGSGRLRDLMDGAVAHTGLYRRTNGEPACLIAEKQGQIGSPHHHALHLGMGVERTFGDQATEVDARLQIIVEESVSEPHRLVAEFLS